MGWMEFVLGLLTLILGTGWLFTYRAYRRKADGEATQSEAEGWKAMQDLYQQTIEDFKVYSEDMRKERTALKNENNDMREKYKKLDDEILLLKKQLSRQGRKLEALSPFLCSVIGCRNRKRDNLNAFASDNSEDKEENNNNGN
jgi:uncharacterized protein YPO0396